MNRTLWLPSSLSLLLLLAVTGCNGAVYRYQVEGEEARRLVREAGAESSAPVAAQRSEPEPRAVKLRLSPNSWVNIVPKTDAQAPTRSKEWEGRLSEFADVHDNVESLRYSERDTDVSSLSGGIVLALLGLGGGASLAAFSGDVVDGLPLVGPLIWGGGVAAECRVTECIVITPMALLMSLGFVGGQVGGTWLAIHGAQHLGPDHELAEGTSPIALVPLVGEVNGVAIGLNF